MLSAEAFAQSMPEVSMNELGTPRDALQAYSKLLSGSGECVRLHCSLPTCCALDGDETLDLHDLHAMRTRCLAFLDELVRALRVLNVPASYKLAPSSSPCCFVCAVPRSEDATKIRDDALEAVSHTRYAREKMLLADLKCGPAIIIT